MNGAYKRVVIGGKTYYQHRLVWELEHGPIPLGHVVHHKDENKHNNSIDNLELVERGKHVREHADAVKHLPAYKAMKAQASRSRPMKAYKCLQCGIDAVSPHHAPKFCSVKCKNAARSAA